MRSSPGRNHAKRAKLDADDQGARSVWLQYAADSSSAPVEEEKFHWKKRDAAAHRAGMSQEDMARLEADRRKEAEREVERLQARRAERERRQQQRREDEERRARQAEAEAMADWQAKEDEFMLAQAKTRAIIRAREHRAKPIDLLVLLLLWSHFEHEEDEEEDDQDDEQPPGQVLSRADDEEMDMDVDVALEEPGRMMSALAPADLQALHDDVILLARWEKEPSRAAYWRDVLLLCNDMLQGPQHDDTTARLDPSIRADIDAMLADKTPEELLTLQTSIREKLRSGEPLDVEYWESMLRRLVVVRSHAKLRTMYDTMMTMRVASMHRRQRQAAQQEALAMAEHVPQIEAPASARDAWMSSMEPPGRPPSELTADEKALPYTTWPAMQARLCDARRRVLQQPFVPRATTAHMLVPSDTAADAMVRREAARAMGVQEEVFNEDVHLTQQAYRWQDKYRPRKPRYFNRVHTGYEWNKYNQTHYDAEHPPPKIVQGYKFNIFYPDLIDPSHAPTYRVLADPEGPGGTQLLRFSAGPPYEDVAFRIVERPWDYSYKRGFRCSFDRGVLQLYCTYAHHSHSQFQAAQVPQVVL